MTEAQELADLIHEKQCNWNHTDGCSWYYGSWENADRTRDQYLEKACAILEEVSFKVAMKVVGLV